MSGISNGADTNAGKVGFAYSDKMLLHKSREGLAKGRSAHPETPARVSVAHEALAEVGLLTRCVALPIRPVRDAELLRVHTSAHLTAVAEACAAVRDKPDDRTLTEPHGARGIYFHAETDVSARAAASCTLAATEAVVLKQVDSAFALVRPPGHHAGPEEAVGFCFYNSVAVAAAHALSLGLERVAIVDWDVHHGNGTQEIFERQREVMFISLHRGGSFFPGTGTVDEVGEGEGKGYNVNIPWRQAGLGDADYLAAFDLIVLPILMEFDPQLILVSAGFDAANGDKQGRMSVTPDGFGAMAHRILRLGAARAVFVLEGGYAPEVVAQCAAAVVSEQLKAAAAPAPKALSPNFDSSLKEAMDPRTPELLREVILIHKQFWPCLDSTMHQEFLADCLRSENRRGRGKRVNYSMLDVESQRRR